MKTFICAAVTALLATSIPATSAFADDNVCMSSEELEASLIDWYGEEPVEPASNGPNQMWVSETTGTWTLVQYSGNGTACVLSTGSDWRGEGPALHLSGGRD